jgi:tetratricopeptide (TPR) repeat protein
VRARLALAHGLVRANRRDLALRLLDTLVGEKPVGARTLLQLGELGLALGRLEQVSAIARRMGRLHPTSGHAPYLQGVVLLRERRQRRQARARFEAALMREPGHLESTLALARLAFERGDLHGGRALYHQAHRRAGRAPEITLELARSYFAHKRIRSARKAYVRAALGYRLLGARYRAAEVLAELGHRLSGIERYRHRSVKRILLWALRLSSRPARAHLYLGRFLEARGRLDEALAAYRRATRHGPEIPEGFYHLGSLLLATRQDMDQAEQALQRFLDLTPRPRGRKAHNARSWVVRIQKRRRYLKRRK